MRTLNSAREVLTSLPIDVMFAGFRGNTLSLAKAGWDLSIQEGHAYHHGHYEMRLAMRHEGAKLYAISYPLTVPYGDLYSVMGNDMGLAKFIAHACFEIMCVAPSIQFQTIPMNNSARMSDLFNPIDANPQYAKVEDMKDFRFFRTANPSVKDIIVLPEMVPDLLAKVLEAQKPVIDEVRKREKSRENMTAYHEAGLLSSYPKLKPMHNVHLQLVTLTEEAA